MKERKSREEARESDRTHTEIQGWLRDLGSALGFQVWIAANDRSRMFGSSKLSDGCLTQLPLSVANAGDAVALIDVIWFEPDGRAAAAFEVEHTTSIYSGIVRLLDLAHGTNLGNSLPLFLVAPDKREEEVREQLLRPAFRSTSQQLRLRYVPYGELEKHRDSISRFGTGLKAMEAIARQLV
jgi:type II restriction enzyme